MTYKRKSDALQEQNGHKRPRNYTDLDAKLAKLFDNLSSDHPKVRIKAAHDLVKTAAGTGVDSQSLSQSDKIILTDDNWSLSNPNHGKLSRIFKRLVRGLCSSRKAARHGFFIALAEFLRVSVGSFTLPLDAIVLIKQNTEPEIAAKGQERRDHEIGRLSGFHALIQSEVLFRHGNPEFVFKSLIQDVFESYGQATWLREQYASILCETVQTLERLNMPLEFVQTVLRAVCENDVSHTPDGIAIWLEAMSRFPEMSVPQDIWPNNDPLHVKSIDQVINALKGNEKHSTADAESQKRDMSGRPQEAPHLAWEVVLKHATSRDELQGKQECLRGSLFAVLWHSVVEDHFFRHSASPERKSIGLTLFAHVIATSASWTFAISISPNLTTCLVNQSAKSERYLHSIAKSVLDSMVHRSSQDSEAASKIVLNLCCTKELFNFDKATNSKTIHKVLLNIDDNALDSLVDAYGTYMFQQDAQDPKKCAKCCQTIADQLLNLLRSRNFQLEEHETMTVKPTWVSSILAKLAWGCCETQLPQSLEAGRFSLPPEAREVLRSRLMSCLSHIISVHPERGRQVPRILVRKLFNYFGKELRAMQSNTELERGMITFAVGWVCSELDKNIDRKQHISKSVDEAFSLTFAITLIQVFCGEIGALDVLEDTHQACESLISKEQGPRKVTSSFIDLVLGFMAQKSVLHRKLAELVFGIFADQLDENALQTMIEVLEQRENTAGQQILFEKVDEGEQNGNVKDWSVDEDDDVQELDELDDHEGNSDCSSEDSSDSDASSSSTSSTSSEVARFDAALASTLKTSKPDNDSIDKEHSAMQPGSDSESSDVSMTDSQMLELEPNLTKIFEMRFAESHNQMNNKSKIDESKRRRAAAKENVVNLKNRVLDLLNIWLKQYSSQPLTLQAVVPLLGLIRRTRTKQIADKATSILRAYYDAAKRKGLPVLDPVDASPADAPIRSLVEDVHAEATRSASKTHSAASSAASLFLSRCAIMGLYPDDPQGEMQTVWDGRREMRWEIDTIYRDTWHALMDNPFDYHGGLPLSFWREWEEWCMEIFVKRRLRSDSGKGEKQGAEYSIHEAEPGPKKRKRNKKRKSKTDKAS